MKQVNLVVTILCIMIYNTIKTEAVCLQKSCVQVYNYTLMDIRITDPVALGSKPASSNEECCKLCTSEFQCTLFSFVDMSCYFFKNIGWEDLTLNALNLDSGYAVGSPFTNK
jgi:hypothetical protein